MSGKAWGKRFRGQECDMTPADLPWIPQLRLLFLVAASVSPSILPGALSLLAVSLSNPSNGRVDSASAAESRLIRP